MAFNSGYLKTKRGIVKIVQIVLGIICIYLLCVQGLRGNSSSCFQQGERVAFASGVNSAFLFLNIILFVLTLFDVSAVAKVEKYFAILGLILFAVAFGLLLWYNVQFSGHGEWIAAMVVLGIIGGLFAFDFMIITGKASD